MDKPETEKIKRYAVVPVSIPHTRFDNLKNYPRKDLILVVGDAPGIKSFLMAALTAENFRVRQVTLDPVTGSVQDGGIPDKLLSDPSIKKTSGDRVGGIIHLSGFSGNRETSCHTRNSVVGFFAVLKFFEKDIKASAGEGGGLILNITGLGGQFGLGAIPGSFSAEAAGTIGVVKSAALEWPRVTTRCIDVDPSMGADLTAARLWEEILTGPAVIETGIDKDGRLWKPEPLESSRHFKSPDIDSESILLLLGGASGITGVIAEKLARMYKAHLVVVGRIPPHEILTPEISGITNRADLRDFFISALKENRGEITPAQIDRRIDHIMKRRAFKKQLNALKSTGAKIEYHALDVRDESALAHLIDDLYFRYGRIDGVVHGAGIIEDSRIRDKTIDSFCNVYDTKVTPAKVFAKKLKPETLKFLVFFSSVAARFGNIGQYDYSGANEVLNKMALHLATVWPKTRVVSIGWGPWDMGMVSDELQKYYKEKGIPLIPGDVGPDFFLNELGLDTDNSPEILVTSEIQQISKNELGLGTE